jgi:hypothetical protein
MAKPGNDASPQAETAHAVMIIGALHSKMGGRR